ncbi:MAG: dTDP-4-dehydrorhamnose reductase [Bacillota bacterium]
MKVLLVGKNGQVGWELQRTLAPFGEIAATGSHELDLSDTKAIRRIVREIKPRIIVNAAAYTAVDRAEEEPELAMAVNGIAPGVLADEAARLGAVMVHYSTDYIFDGKKGLPYLEEDTPNPINVYGKTKLAGEWAIRETGASHLIFRTSWVYGLRGKNFLLTILRLAREKEELNVVQDQVGTPNWCATLAEATAGVLMSEHNSIIKDKSLSGVYNLSSSGETSWFEFARQILAADPRKEEQACRKINPITTAQYPTTAKRPLYSVLGTHKIQSTFGVKIGSWDDCLREAFLCHRT